MADNMTPEPTAAGMPVANPRSYLGHFAHNAVMEQGHNVGHKRIGAAVPVPSVAKRGFTKLPGTAVNQQGHARYGEAPTGLPPTRAEKMASKKLMASMPVMQAPAMPRAVSDMKLSIKHHRQSIANDEQHMRDHKASIAHHRAMMKMRGKQLRGRK